MGGEPDVERLVGRADWPRLAAIAACWLEQRPLPPGLTPDDVQGFLAARLLPDGEAFWRPALARCVTEEALRRYLRRAVERYALRVRAAGLGDIAWVRRRATVLLREDRRGLFRREPWRGESVYGRAVWADGPEALGEYRAHWHELSSRFAKHGCFERRPTSERVGPYADADLEEGCGRLLDACGQYARAFKLGDGLVRSGWLFLLRLDSPVAELPEVGSRPGPPARLDLDDHLAVLREALAPLTDDQRQALVLYALPRCLAGEGDDRAPTLHEVGALLGVSHTTVKNRADAALRGLRGRLEDLDEAERLAALHVLLHLLETGGLGRLMEGEE